MTVELHRLIDRGAAQPVINERVAALIERGDASTRDNDTCLKDHEMRLRRLENRTNWGMGVIAGISALISAAAALWAKAK